MKIVATEQEIVDAIRKMDEYGQDSIMLSESKLRNALKSLPTLKDELTRFSEFIATDLKNHLNGGGSLKGTFIDRYLATHSKQG